MSANAQIDIRGNMTRREINLSRRPSFPRKYAEPWDITISGSTATFSRCGYRRGHITVLLPDFADVALTGSDTECFVGARIDLSNGDCEILSSGTSTDVLDVSLPSAENAKYIKLFLYRLTRSSATAFWRVAEKWSDIPDITVYV